MVAIERASTRWCGTLAWGVALSLVVGPVGSACSADLPRYLPAPPPPILRGDGEASRYRPLESDPGPASASGYYGYYGTDILGVPYRGLYSENVLCIRAVVTRHGYRTVYVC